MESYRQIFLTFIYPHFNCCNVLLNAKAKKINIFLLLSSICIKIIPKHMISCFSAGSPTTVRLYCHLELLQKISQIAKIRLLVSASDHFIIFHSHLLSLQFRKRSVPVSTRTISQIQGLDKATIRVVLPNYKHIGGLIFSALALPLWNLLT